MGSFSKNSLIGFITTISTVVLGFVCIIIISRILGPEGKGIYSLILLIPGLIINFGGFGIGSANIYLIGNKKYKVEEIVSNSLFFSVVLGFSVVLIFFGITRFSFFQQFLSINKIPVLYIWLVIFSIPLSFLLDFFRGIICGMEEMVKYNKTRILEAVIQLGALVIFLLVLKYGLLGALFSYLFSIIVAVLYLGILVGKLTKLYFSFNKKLARDSFFYGGKVYMANTLSFLNYRLDMIMVAVLLGPSVAPAAVGYYSIAVAVAEKLFMIPNAFSTVLFPKISNIKNPEEANNFTPQVVRHTLFIILICSLVLFFSAKPLIIFFFGNSFLPSVIPLLILLPGIVSFSVGGVLAADLAGRGKPQFAIYSSLVCLIINLPLNFFLIPRYGIAGAALASTVAYFFDTLVILAAFVRISKKSLSEVLVFKFSDINNYFRLILQIKNKFKK